jgi:ABC-2 type transport system ATP-binding protein
MFGMTARTARAETHRLLEQFRLGDRAGVPVAALSGGMAQRLMVARAIMHRPAILFLDEPTAGLDPQSRIGLWEIVSTLHETGQTTVLTTHNMEEADELCDRIGIMDHGHILALGTPAELKESVGADTIVTVSSDGDLDQLARSLCAQVEGVDGATVLDGSVQVAVRGTDRVLVRVIGAAEQVGHVVRDLQVAPPSLETVFIRLTGKDLRD